MKLLKEIANVSSGHPFRGKIVESNDGNGKVIQIKNVDEDGTIDWDNLITSDIQSRFNINWLRANDIIIPNRGRKLVSAHLEHEPRGVVVTPHFYIIRVFDDQVDPAFLSWQLNQSVSQRYFEVSAEGTLQTSIRKAVVEDIQLTIPPIGIQKKIVKLNDACNKEKTVLTSLIENRKKELQGITNSLLKKY